MSVSLARAKKLARTLLRENRKNGRSWRVIAHEDFNDRINYATLNRFAIHKGEWFPKDKELQIILGIRKPRPPRQKQKTMMQMNKKELLDYIQQRVDKWNAVLLRRAINARVTLNTGRDA